MAIAAARRHPVTRLDLPLVRDKPMAVCPLIDFLRLASGSHLIDAGVNVGLPFNGSAPDLGWAETAAIVPALPGDYDGNGTVDLADYVMWLIT